MKFHPYFCESTDPFSTVEWTSRNIHLKNAEGKTIYENVVEAPSFWSDQAVQIVASKYFYGGEKRESSVKQLIFRVSRTITDWGIADGYFADKEEAECFYRELTWLCLHQYGVFNSPVLFNVGLNQVYGIKDERSRNFYVYDFEKKRVVKATDTLLHPQVSACQPYWSSVVTPVGNMKIGEIAENNMVGLTVFDASGVTKVVATKKNGKKPVYRIMTKSGHFLDATADHLVWRQTGGSNGSGKFVRLDEIKRGDRLRWIRTDVASSGKCNEKAIAEAALAGWLQSDGFVGQYKTNSNKSLTIEAITVIPAEFEWVMDKIKKVFPNVHYHVREQKLKNDLLSCKRIRLYGNVLRPFVEKWNLLERGIKMQVPEKIQSGIKEEKIAYLRSIFQAEGYVTGSKNNHHIACDMISEKVIRGLSSLLASMGIFSRVRTKIDKRKDRHNVFSLSINTLGDRRRFAEIIGFLDEVKNIKVKEKLELKGFECKNSKSLTVEYIEYLGVHDVYDIQTKSGEYLSNNFRIHNCFILSLDDTMDSIMALSTAEAMLYKYGSGIGVNYSTLRSSKERISGGGFASGPLSFMCISDQIGGVVRSGGKTRRAAALKALNADHPDILEFIDAKMLEEKKAHALIREGYTGGIEGDAYRTVMYQNSNFSIRVRDDFMLAYENDSEWDTKAVTTGRVMDTFKAKEILSRIAKAAHFCGDPGIQFHDTFNKWNTCKASGIIFVTNPCSEFCFLNNSACNLASINLLRFWHENERTFNVEAFKKAIEVFITAQDILVDRACYPTKKVAENSHRFRPLGLGYTNLGALLMTMGVPYESELAYHVAAGITSLMTSKAFLVSSMLARKKNLGSFEQYGKNAKSFREVMKLHKAENDKRLAREEKTSYDDFFVEADALWKEVLGSKSFRNAQVTLLAPTGTTSFFMDCDTTGIEPDFALLKYKKLINGETMKIINRCVEPALKVLGYSEQDIVEISEYVYERGTFQGMEKFNKEHLPVFKCAQGDNPISYMGHIMMMAAVQPFLSGSISKTVNLPEQTKPEEIEKVYWQAWKLGLKSVSVFRDGSKVSPLSAGKKPDKSDLRQVPRRYKLPDTCKSIRHKFTIGGHEGYFNIGLYDDGEPGELFVKMSKQGSTISGLMDCFSIAVSIMLQYGIPFKDLMDKFAFQRFEPSGFTNVPSVGFARSPIDYIFRWMTNVFLDEEEVNAKETNGHNKDLSGIEEKKVKKEAEKDIIGDELICGKCGHYPMQRTGICHACPVCGFSEGCG